MMEINTNKFGLLCFCILSSLLTLLNGCKAETKKLSVEDYIKFTSSVNSPLILEKEINDIKYSIKLITPELRAIQSGKSFKSSYEINEEVKKLTNQINVTLLISDASKESHIVKQSVFDNKSFAKIIDYCSEKIYTDFYLIENGKKYFPSLVFLDPANSISPVIRISAAFNKVFNPNLDLVFVFNDKIYDTGYLKFNYTNKVINTLPKLEYKN